MPKKNKAMLKLQKKIANDSGALLVRVSGEYAPGIVELLRLYDKNTSGCVIAYWEERQCDGEPIAEAHSVGDRLINTDINSEKLMQALKYGQKLAELVIESREKGV